MSSPPPRKGSGARGDAYVGGVACPNCGSDKKSIVADTRGGPGYCRRRRRCRGCGLKFTTYEVNKMTNFENLDNWFSIFRPPEMASRGEMNLAVSSLIQHLKRFSEKL